MVLEIFLDLIRHGSYFTVFIASFLTSSSVLIPILPFPSYFPVIVGVGAGLNPFVAGSLGGIGSALGDVIGYLVGMGGSATIEKFEKKVPKFIKKFERFYSKIGFLIVLTFAFLPFPFDIVGILSGVSKYNFKRFLLALTIGRVTRTLLIAYGASFAIPFVLNLFS